MRWRLGLDLGTNSIGWSVFKYGDSDKLLKDGEFIDGGVRVFPDGREPQKGGRVGDSLAVNRRLARGARRNRDRGNGRLRFTVNKLVTLGLMPQDKTTRKKLEAHDPYDLRKEALERPLTSYELGRALFHLAKRRGFKSNRKEASTEDGKQATKITSLREELYGKTLGEYFFQKKQSGEKIRFDKESTFFPDRAMYEDEFNRIKAVQQQHHELSESDWDEILEDCILFQRPLKAVERGCCALRPEFSRTWRDMPVSQDFRILQDIRNLRYEMPGEGSIELNRLQQDAIFQKLNNQKTTLRWDTIRKLKGPDKELLFPFESKFNFEDDGGKKKGLEGHCIAWMMKKDPILSDIWDNRDNYPLDDIFTTIHEAHEDEALVADLVEKFALSKQEAAAFADLPVTSVTVNLSREAMDELVEIMAQQGLDYAGAVTEMVDKDGNRLSHSSMGDPGDYDQLPYYGEILANSTLGKKPEKNPETDPEGYYGRIPNVSVHLALNQLRKLVNHLIGRFGKPQDIIVELSRDLKLGPKQRTEINTTIAKNEKVNKDLRDIWLKISGGREANARDLKKMKLWEELSPDEPLSRRCPFSGRGIAAHHLINSEVEIEHILPFSRTLDDSMANLTLAFRDANKAKGNQTPFEAFGERTVSGYDWEAIAQRGNALPKNKRWRFTSDAMDRFEGEGSFIARQLTDNAYIARSARLYLRAICKDVKAAPGRMTAMIRGKWHLNIGEGGKKSRDDHRHHAIDAFTVALSDTSLLQQVAKLSAKGVDTYQHINLPDLPDSMRAALKDRLDSMIISYKQDHGTRAGLYKETAYGVIPEDKQLDGYNLVVRKPIDSLSITELDAIRDERWLTEIKDYLYKNDFYDMSSGDKKKKLPDMLKTFGLSQNPPVKKLRILVKNQSAKEIPSAPYKAYAPDSYVCCDIWQVPKGKKGKWQKDKFTWEGAFWPYVDCRGDEVPHHDGRKPHPAAKFIMRLFKNDMVEYYDGGQHHIMRVASFSTTNNKLDLKPHLAANAPRQYYSINTFQDKDFEQFRCYPDGTPKNRKAKA